MTAIRRDWDGENYRIIWDGREVNRHCGKAEGYRMETLKKLQFLARKGDYMLSADLQDGFFALGIFAEPRKFIARSGLCVSIRGPDVRVDREPSMFCLLMETLVRALRSPIIPHSRGVAHGLVGAVPYI